MITDDGGNGGRAVGAGYFGWAIFAAPPVGAMGAGRTGICDVVISDGGGGAATTICPRPNKQSPNPVFATTALNVRMLACFLDVFISVPFLCKS